MQLYDRGAAEQCMIGGAQLPAAISRYRGNKGAGSHAASALNVFASI